MTMLETEQSILDDLALLGDGLSRMDYLLGCGREAPGIPPEARTPDALVADCQVNTWLQVRWEGETLRLHTDSESLLIKGALSLIGEIYDGRARAEIAAFQCRLLDCGSFTALFDRAQRKGLQAVLNALRGET